MSYSFTTNGEFSGDLGAGGTLGYPVAIGQYIKFADHPAADNTLINLGNSSSAATDSIDLLTRITDGALDARSIDSSGNPNQARWVLSPLTDKDGIWCPVLGIWRSNSDRQIYVGVRANTGTNTTARTVTEALRYISVGRSLVNNRPWEDKAAETAIWNSDLSNANIDLFMGGTSADQIDNANLVCYYPFNVDNLSQADQSGNSGPTLTGTGGLTYESDHPTITRGAFIPVIMHHRRQHGMS